MNSALEKRRPVVDFHDSIKQALSLNRCFARTRRHRRHASVTQQMTRQSSAVHRRVTFADVKELLQLRSIRSLLYGSFRSIQLRISLVQDVPLSYVRLSEGEV
jgi:hypothetical protein